MRLVGRLEPWDDEPPLFVDHRKPARVQPPLALDLYIANAFAAVLRAATDADRAVAVNALLRCPGLIPSKFANPRVRARLAEEAAERGWKKTRERLRAVVFPESILFVTQEFTQAKRIRFGRSWVGDERGRVVPYRPDQLPVVWAARWVRQRVRAQAEVILLDHEGRTAGLTSVRRAEVALFMKRPEVPEEIMLRRTVEPSADRSESTSEPLQALFRYLARRLSPREQELLRLQRLGQSTPEIAAAFGCSVGAVRQARHRLQKKLGT